MLKTFAILCIPGMPILIKSYKEIGIAPQIPPEFLKFGASVAKNVRLLSFHSKFLSLGRRRNTEFFSVFGDGSPGDVQTLFVQYLHDLLVRQGMLAGFLGHQFLDLFLH